MAAAGVQPNMSIAEKVKRLRQAKGWNTSDLARSSGIAQPTVWRVEKGIIAQPKASTLRRLAQALGVSTDYLVAAEEDISFDGKGRPSTGIWHPCAICRKLVYATKSRLEGGRGAYCRRCAGRLSLLKTEHCPRCRGRMLKLSTGELSCLNCGFAPAAYATEQ